MTGFIVEVSAKSRAAPKPSRKAMVINTWALLLLGVFLIVSMAAAGIVMIISRTLEWQVLGWFWVMLVGVVFVWLGASHRRGLQRDPGDPVQLAPPYAFEVKDSKVNFPGGFWGPVEQWPLSQTTIERATRFGFASLRLSSPGKKTRNFPAVGLKESPDEILSRLQTLS